MPVICILVQIVNQRLTLSAVGYISGTLGLVFILPANSKTFFFAVVAALGFALQDAVVKMLTVNGSLWQLMLLRSL